MGFQKIRMPESKSPDQMVSLSFDSPEYKVKKKIKKCKIFND
jgi:hypothetical protein